MKNKATWIAVGLFAVLLAVVFATRDRHVSEGIKTLSIPHFDKQKIVEVEISGPQNAVLKHEGGGWSVSDPKHPGASHLADSAQVETLLDAVGELKAGDLVTERAERQAELEVDDAKGLHLKVMAEGAPPAEWIFGKSARGGTYIRAAGQNDVFTAQGRLPWVARKDASGWRKHQIVSAKVDDFSRIELKRASGDGFAISRDKDAAWTLDAPPPGFRFDSGAAQRLAQQVATLTASDFADVTAVDGLGLGATTIEAKLKDGKTLKLELGKPIAKSQLTGADAGTSAAPDVVAVRLDGDPQIYLLSKFTADPLTQGLSGVRDLSLMSFDAQKVKKLVIHGAKPVVAQKDKGTWKITEPAKIPAGLEFDPAQVMTQLQRIRMIHASRLIEGKVSDAEAGLSKPVATVEVTLDDGKTQSLKFGKPVPGSTTREIYARGSADGALYAIGEFEKTRFDAGVDLFRKPPPAPNFAGGGNFHGLDSLPPDVRRQLEAQLRQRGMGMGHP